MDITFETFNLKSPYTRFDRDAIPKNVEIQNWQYPDSSMAFDRFIAETDPKVIIELGSWFGWSAIEMAKLCKKHGVRSKILCVDTWLGSIEHWRKDKCDMLKVFDHFSNGTSTMFDAFCKNVISHGVDDMIIPMPNTTVNAHKLFSHLGVTAKLIYVDASHEFKDVLEDLTAYYFLLEDGGYIFGDDAYWPEIQAAANSFSGLARRPVMFSEKKNLYYFVK